MDRRKDRAPTPGLWIAANELPPTGGHPFYQRLNQVLDAHAFDDFVEAQCAPCYATTIGRPSLTPARTWRLLLIGYFETVDSERGIAWRTATRWRCGAFWARASTKCRRSTRRCGGRGVSSVGRRTARSSRGSCIRSRQEKTLENDMTTMEATRRCAASCGAARSTTPEEERNAEWRHPHSPDALTMSGRRGPAFAAGDHVDVRPKERR